MNVDIGTFQILSKAFVLVALKQFVEFSLSFCDQPIKRAFEKKAGSACFCFKSLWNPPDKLGFVNFALSLVDCKMKLDT